MGWISRISSVALAFGLVACESAISNEDAEARLEQNDWMAESIGGQAVIQPGRVTLAFLEGRVSGRSGCNRYSGPVEVGTTTMKVGPLISTKMACMEAGLMQQESAYLNALQSAQSYSIDGTTLSISDAAATNIYTATARQAVPAN